MSAFTSAQRLSADHTLAGLTDTLPRRESVSETAYRILKDALLDGRLGPGVRINELELARIWRISRTPIRDALRRLEADGLVRTVPGRGAVVPRLDQVEVVELFEVLAHLEGWAARRAGERCTPEFASTLNQQIKALAAAAKQGAAAQADQFAGELRRTVTAFSGNQQLVKMIDRVRLQLDVAGVTRVRGENRTARSVRELAKLVAAVRARDGGRAEAAMRKHMEDLAADAAENVARHA